jgi:hypothetical protein
MLVLANTQSAAKNIARVKLQPQPQQEQQPQGAKQ